MRIIIAGIEFRALEAATNHARKIKERYKDGDRLTEHDDIFMRGFVALHPHSEEKIGCGIAGFTVQTDRQWKNSRQFVLLRIDGSRAIFSHNRLRAKPETPEERKKRKALAALRQAVVSQVVEFRNRNFIAGKTRCPYTEEILTLGTLHVDHQYPATFAMLVVNWMEDYPLNWKQLEVYSDTDNQTKNEMCNPDQMNSWQRFHACHAKLRLISQKANLSQAKRG